jgi:hypothetical protein
LVHQLELNQILQRKISLNYYDILKFSVKTSFNELPDSISIKSEFSKLYLKNNGKFYSCLIPKFFKKFSISKQSEPQFNKLLRP